MSDDIKDGGPAFPPVHVNEWGNSYSDDVNGMSLRDYFAGQALGHSLTETLRYMDQRDTLSARAAAGVANECYLVADAMLAAREAK